ncbi:hypothetical protein [Streptosporangium sp. NPDC049376]|uniref:hypothetical protein n=1 Tax=Streptosporangium sp. NPDC049376 TaxID=3366192 RepID=UPI0037BD94B9
MDTSQTAGLADEPHSDRATAERLYRLALQAFAGSDMELSAMRPAERAQVLLLQAIYHELRHGRGQAGAQSAALAEHSRVLNTHSEALTDHADEMDRLRSAMLGHSDALGRSRR